jgi:UDP-N-acetylmuramate dehydrogenase
MEQQSNTGLFYVGAGASLMRVARDLSGAGYAGLEFAGGIPASIGGAVYMNAGAHGGEMSSIITRVRVCQPDGSIDELVHRDLPVAYRRGGIPDGAIVMGAWLQLVEGDRDSIEKRRQTFLEHRKQTQPLHLPSAGSVFKNPPGLVAGRLIEEAGLRGTKRGGAQISPQHGNWIVNPDRTALASDVLYLMELCRSRVLEQTTILLETEQKMW